MVTPTLIIALLISSIWLAYIAFYNSRIQGLLCTWILRQLGYIKDAEVKFGSISVSILGGKIMFRELRYITKDFALRSVDGAFIFKWFTRLSPDDISRESQTWSLYHIIFQSRALLTLHGLEVHIYNRTSLYDDLEKVAKSELDVGMPEDRLPDPDSNTTEPVVEDNTPDKWGLRNLIPVLVVEVQKGKFVVGNKLTETVMFVDIETATAIYSTPSSKKQQLDPYMHMIRSKINKIRITLNRSPEFKGQYETPPSQPEAGVPLLRSREVRIQYIQDMPGRVTKLQRSAESSPEWEMTLKFMRETHIHYGPWLDRQRDILYKFFFPYDYKVAEVSKPLKVGDLRRHQHLNVIIDFEAKATLTILFFREEATSSINLDIANGSRVQMQIPWTVSPQGFTTQIVADLYKVECQTSMDYRPFLEADEVHAIFQFQYPRVWHHRQSWECDFFSVSRPTVHFVFDLIAFLTDLLDDWSPVIQPDLLTFVPYVWRFDFKFTDALIVLPVSQHNWVDCIQNRIENSETVFFGLHCEMLDVHFELPWTNYQPATTEVRFDFNAEDITGSIWLPKYHTLRDSLKQFNMGKVPAWLDRAHVDRVGEETGSSNKDKNVTAHDLEGWEECWSLQDLFLRFTFLSNSALPYERPGYNYNFASEDKTNHLGVEVMLGPSVIRLHGVFFRHLWFFKDNYFGYDDKCTPLAYLYNRALIDKNKNLRVKRPTKECPIYDLDVTCKVIVKDILGEFPRHCDEPNVQIKLPIAQIDGIVFELVKTRQEAKMELTISPITFLFSDSFKRSTLDMHLAHGFLQLQGVSVLMCGLYSGVGINNPKNPFDFLEYGFLVEVTTGALVGKLTVPHIQQLVHWLEIFLWQSLDRENEMPITEHQINIERVHSASHHVQETVQTDGSSAIKEYHNFKLKTSQQKKLKTDDLKYLMIKVSIARTDLYVVEAGCACSIATKSIRVALCNAHDETTTLGVTLCVQGADVTQYVRLPHEEDKVELENKSQWLEAGVLSLPPIMFDVNKRLGDPCQYKEEQREFLKCHDKINQCLLFLWMPEEYKGCGCVGGVTFNNTTLIEVNGFYFDPVVVPPDFCQSASPNSNTPWKLGRGASVVGTDGSSRTSPGSSISSRQSDKRKHVSELLHSQGFGGLSPADCKPKKPPTGKKKTKGRDSGEWFTTFPQRSGARKRDKQKTLSHYNDLLKNFSIKRNISRLSSKRKSRGSDIVGSEHSVSQHEPALKIDTQDEVEEDGEEEHALVEDEVGSSNPSITVTTEFAPMVEAVSPAIKGSTESLEANQYESAEDEATRRASKQSLPHQSPTSTGASKEDKYSSLGRRSKSRGGTLSRSSSQDSFKSARSEFRNTDAASSAAEEEHDTTEAEDEENQVKDLSIPFPFPKAADSALNHELIDIYRDHLPRAWLTETRYSNTVVLNKSYSDLEDVDTNKIPHRISSNKRQSKGSKGSDDFKIPPVEPSIHELLQIVKYILPEFHSESTGSTSSDLTTDNLFSNDSAADNKSDPKLLELRRKWEKKLKEKKVSTDETSDPDSLETDGKVICIAEIVDPVDLFFTPFCVHAINKYIETAEVYYRNLHPAAVINLVQAATAPTVLEIAIQHATAQKALLFSHHLQPVGMKKFDNSLERTIEERLNLELFLYIPVVSIRTLQGGGDLQWVGTEAELETARSKAQVPSKSGTKSGAKSESKFGGVSTTDDEAMTDRSESARSDISGDPSSGAGSSNVICPNKIAKLSLVKFVANNIDVSFSYHQFERQKPMASGGTRSKSVMDSALPGEYTQTAYKASVDGIFGQLHILHPMIGKQSDTFIPYTKTRVVAAKKIKDNVQKLSSRETSVVIELGAEKCNFSGGSLKRNLLVALPEPPEQQKPKKKEEEKQDIPSFALDGDSIDIELGKQDPSSNNIPFKYKKLRPKASIHYHSGPDRMSLSSSLMDEAQEPLISDDNSSSEDVLTVEGIEYKRLESDRDEGSSEKVSMGAQVAASLTSLADTTAYHDKSSINGKISELWIQIATPSADQTDVNLFNPYTSLPHAVFSWSEPGSLLAQHVTQLSHNKLSRVQAVIAALLAEALGQEIQYEPPNYTTKHSRLTIASKTLKESAVIRLMNQLRYTLEICKDSNTDLYHDLNPDFVPRRILLERGVQSMLAAIEGNLLLTNDNLMDNISVQQPPPTSHHSPPSNLLPDAGTSDNYKTPVYYVGKQDYGSIAALDKISIGKPPQNVQVEAKHRTHRHALIEMLSSSDKAKLAEKYFALYQALQLRLPKTDHVNHQLKLEIDGTSITAIDCHRDFRSDTAASPFFNAKNLFLETSLFPAQKDFSIPRHTRDGTHKRNDSRSSSGVGGGRSFHRSDSTDSLFSKRSSHSNRHNAASTPGGAPPRPPRKKKSKKFLDIQMAQNVKKSISHVVKHLVINTQIETCVTEINLDLLRLSKALVDGMSNFQPGSFHPVLGDFTVISGSGPASPTGDPPLRSVEDQFMLAGAWEKMDEYIQLMFRGDPMVARMSSETSKSLKPRINRDIMLYSEAPDIPLSVTATWRFDKAEIIGRLQGLKSHINVKSISGAAAILQNLYVEMNNSPNSDIILEPLSPNIISGNLDETSIAVSYYDDETEQDCELICIDVPTLNTVYSFLPHVTRIQKVFINVTELKAKVPKPIVEIKNVLLISTKLVLHEIKSFERYFHRPQQSLQRIHIENSNKHSEIDLNLLIRAASFDLYLLPSLSLKHEIGDLHIRFAQSKGLTAQLDIHHHELSLNAEEIDLHTHLPLPQIFIRGEKVKKRDPSGIRSGIHGEHYTGVVEIKTFQLQLPTTMLNHVLLVQNAFMKEINEFLDTINLIRYTVEKTNPIAKSSSSLPTSPHMIPFAFTMKLQGIDLLATTPSDLAMSLKTETINVEVKNRMVTERITVARDREQIIERPRMFISTMITTDITLGQLADIDPGVPRSSEEDMIKFLQFRATASLGNDEGLFENKLSSSESFHATISNPQLFMQPGAFDKALLFYLNFKTAYAIFNDDRQKLNVETVTATETFKNRFNLPEGPPVLPTNTQLKMTVKNLAVCLPIQRSNVTSPGDELLSASQTDLVKYSASDGALSISIKTAEMKMAFGTIHNNKGLFNDFVIRFIDEFDEKKWMENAVPRSSEKEMNSIAVDSGNYDYTTLTTSPTVTNKETGLEGEQSGKMTVGVNSDIKGVNIHLSTNIITKLVGLYKTLTSIVGTDDPKDGSIELIDETELVKNLGVESAEKGQFDEEQAVKIWKRTALHADKKDNKLERTTSGGKRKKPPISDTVVKEKKPDEVSMFSTRTSRSVLGRKRA
ncbi:bridge-like lipid transfer protein family member 1 isoform X2 [Bolinopsis microptera]|uniref:bridge-like lipid transfer protein family member 1 isoform X2 n=1 Tax=Bolinopsis microptera TaxID=2820187 RepID=UPI0030799BE7